MMLLLPHITCAAIAVTIGLYKYDKTRDKLFSAEQFKKYLSKSQSHVGVLNALSAEISRKTAIRKKLVLAILIAFVTILIAGIPVLIIHNAHLTMLWNLLLAICYSYALYHVMIRVPLINLFNELLKLVESLDTNEEKMAYMEYLTTIDFITT